MISGFLQMSEGYLLAVSCDSLLRKHFSSGLTLIRPTAARDTSIRFVDQVATESCIRPRNPYIDCRRKRARLL